MSAPTRTPNRGQQNQGDDAIDAAVTTAVAFAAALLVLPLALAHVVSKMAAARPLAWRRAGWRLRTLAALTAVSTLAVAALTAPALARAAWPITWPATALPVLGWWALMCPSALVWLRLRVRHHGTAVLRGSIDPARAEPIRAAHRAALVADLFAKAGARISASRRPETRQGRAPLPHLAGDGRGVLGSASIRDLGSVWHRIWTRAAKREPLSPWHAGRRTDGLAVLPHEMPRALVVAASGHGKTVLQFAMVLAALRMGARVLWMDGKGDSADGRKLLDLAEAEGYRTRWWPRDSYDLWRGDRHAVVAKALKMLPAGGPQFYAQADAAVLAALASVTPWRSTAELLERLQAPGPHLAQDEHHAARLASLTRRINGVTAQATTYAAITASLVPFARDIDPGKGQTWSLDDDPADPWDLAVMSLDVGGNPFAASVAAAVLTDLNGYRTNRRDQEPNRRPLLVICDEVGAVLADPRIGEALPVLMEQLRSAGIGLVIGAQSLDTLGLPGPRIAASGLDLWLGRIDNPDPLVMMIGTRKRVEMAHQGTAGGTILTGQTAAREQDTLLIDPQELRELPPWTWLVRRAGHAVTWSVVPPPS